MVFGTKTVIVDINLKTAKIKVMIVMMIMMIIMMMVVMPII